MKKHVFVERASARKSVRILLSREAKGAEDEEDDDDDEENQDEEKGDQPDEQPQPARDSANVDGILDPDVDADYWSFPGGVLIIRHLQPRESLFVPTDENCP